MAKLGTEIVSPQTGERLIFRSTEGTWGGELFQAELIIQAVCYAVRARIHPSRRSGSGARRAFASRSATNRDGPGG